MNTLQSYESLSSLTNMSKAELSTLSERQAEESIKGDNPFENGIKACHFFNALIFLSEETIKQIDKKLNERVQSPL